MAKNSEYWEKRIASETWKVYNSIEEKNKELLQFYIEASESVKDELYRLAEKYSKDGVLSLSEMYKQNRLAELNKKYENIIEELGRTTEEFAKKNMQQGFQNVYEKTAKGMGDNDFSMPNKKLMEKMMETPWRGDNFSGRFWKNQKKLAVSLNDVLLTGLQQGKTVTEIAIALHNRMGQGFNECHRLVRTESMHYLNDAALRRYKDAGVEYVQVWAALDERTCDTCGGYHEKIYPIDKCPHVPLHANCRCTVLPVVDSAEYEDGLDFLSKGGATEEWNKLKRKQRDNRAEIDVMNLRLPKNVRKIRGMTHENQKEIENAIRKLQREYEIRLETIETASLGKGTIFSAVPYIDTNNTVKFALVLNEDIDYTKVKKNILNRYQKGRFAGKSIEDYIAHEMAHIMTYQDCGTASEYRTKKKIIQGQFIPKISGYADKMQDGVESLAEAFVRFRNGEKIPTNAEILVRTYIERWKK